MTNPRWKLSLEAAAPLPPLRLDLIETFVLVVEQASFALAADRLFLSPSGVTRRVQALERELGVQLLDRSAKSVVLTAAGSALLPAAIRILTAARSAIASVADAQLSAGLQLLPSGTEDLVDAVGTETFVRSSDQGAGTQ